MYARVVLLRPFSEDFFYTAPENLSTKLKPGQRVLVPLGNLTEIAFIKKVSSTKPTEIKDNIKLKNILELLDEEEIITESMFSFFNFIKNYYFYPLGEIVKSALPREFQKKKETFISKKLIKIKENASLFESQIEVKKISTLNHEQDTAVKKILSQNTNSPFLLHGITGSGKTEVYIESIKSILKEGKEALILVPEIALTPQLIARFNAHFSGNLALFHSGLTAKERFNQWLKVKFKKVKIAIGVRSAIFLPFNSLGIIIVDEEHENTFKQDDRLKYNARDLAILRGKLENAKVILGSATPSFESFYNAISNNYSLLSLSKKACQRKSAEIKIINLRQKDVFYKFTLFSKDLFFAMEENLKKGKQTLLFLNRTGYSNFILCKDCGKPHKCPNCSISLIYFKSNETLKCSYCSYEIKKPKICPDCKSLNLDSIGGGTERVEEDLNKFLPSANISRMDRHTTVSRGSREKIIEDLSTSKIDILIGTQMIAKGLDFHNITVVGVINADMVLNMPDFKASERTFQLTSQVSGRAGRGEYQGQVFIQTYNPDHYVFSSVQKDDYFSFFDFELPFRKELNYPPFSKLVCIKFSGNLEHRVYERSRDVSQILKIFISRNLDWQDKITILGPTKQMLFKVRNKYRYQILLKGKSTSSSNSFIKTFIKNYPKLIHSQGVRITFDIDPVSMV